MSQMGELRGHLATILQSHPDPKTCHALLFTGFCADPTTKHNSVLHDRVTFHYLAAKSLRDADNKNFWFYTSMPSLRKMFKHDRIAVLKMDCEVRDAFFVAIFAVARSPPAALGAWLRVWIVHVAGLFAIEVTPQPCLSEWSCFAPTQRRAVSTHWPRTS